MSAQGHPLILNERRGSTHTTEQAAACPKISLDTRKAKQLPLYTQVTWNKLKVKTKQDKHMPEIPNLGQVQKVK